MPLSISIHAHAHASLATDPWLPLYNTLLDRIHLPQSPLLNPPTFADFLVLSSSASAFTTNRAFICLSSTLDMKTTLTKEIRAQTAQCIQQYGSHRTTILLMALSNHASCLQALEYFLLHNIVSDQPIEQTWQMTAPTTTSRLSEALPTADIPNIVVCRSGKDAADYISLLLNDLDASNSRMKIPLMLSVQPAEDRNSKENLHNIEMGHTSQDAWVPWFRIATSGGQSPLITAKECKQLKKGLNTLQNISSATSGQLRNACLISGSSTKAIETFFDNDEPI